MKNMLSQLPWVDSKRSFEVILVTNVLRRSRDQGLWNEVR